MLSSNKTRCGDFDLLVEQQVGADTFILRVTVRSGHAKSSIGFQSVMCPLVGQSDATHFSKHLPPVSISARRMPSSAI